MRDTAIEKGLSYASYYTVGELASYLGVQRQTVKNWVRRHLIYPDTVSEHGWYLFSPVAARNILQWHLTRQSKLGKMKP